MQQQPDSPSLSPANADAPLMPRTVLVPNTIVNRASGGFISGFDYLVPANVPAGALVEVNLRNRNVVGMVTDASENKLPPSKLKPISRVLDVPYFSQIFTDWLSFIAQYTLAPMGAVFALTQARQALKQPKKPYQRKEYVSNLPALADAQIDAADYLIKQVTDKHSSAPKPILLDGVTGSGKTEVYFHAIAEALKDDDAQVLVLLPEIALTHQLITRFEKAFGEKPDLWHSSVTPSKRLALWHAVANGDARIVVGARSALMLPYKNLKLIIVDEEHDTSYKQEDGVLYHARDMAVARAKFESIPIILASATPALETQYNVREGRYEVLKLPKRHGGTLPEIALIDMQESGLDSTNFIAHSLREAMAETLARGEQVMLFLNRRGYAPLLLCRGCGHRFMCSQCSAWLVLHQGKNQLQCHHCGHHEPAPNQCPECGAPEDKLAPCGPGIERIAEEVQGLFPDLIMDETLALFSTDNKENAAMIDRAITGDIKVLIGTQMLAKGHHFPSLTLVGVIDSDLGLAGGDLRAAEHTYQLLEQLSGRAGRAEKPGRVLLQTYLPDHPVMQALVNREAEIGENTGRNDLFYNTQLEVREEGNWPPYGKLAAIILDGPDEAAVRKAGLALIQCGPLDKRLRILGPAPAPLSKLRGQYRYRLLCKSDKTIDLQQTLKDWTKGANFKQVRVKLDINPYYFL